MKQYIVQLDEKVIAIARRVYLPLVRVALAMIYVWFGALKVFGESPASAMVLRMQQMTVPFIAPGTFMILFGLFEVLIGVLFVVPRAQRVALVLMVVHMVMTALPLVLLPHMVWTGWLVPTLEGQYIIKNIALIAAAVGIVANLKPIQSP